MIPFHYINHSLYAEEIDLADVATTVGTPAYIYSATAIKNHLQEFQQAFHSLNHLICYAAKANSNLAILQLLAREGAGFDVVSGGELFKVLQAGGRADQCTFAGVGKLPHEIEYALQQGIYCFNVESEQKLEVINEIAGRFHCVAPIALRINPDVDAETHHYISTGKSHNKFGIGLDRAEAVYEQAAALPHLKIRGLQTHIGSQILKAAPFAEALKKLTPLILKIKEKHGLEFFSLGGGIGIDYQNPLEEKPNGLTRIFHGDPAAACESLMQTALDSGLGLGSMSNTAQRRNPRPPCLHHTALRLATNHREICGLTPKKYAAQVLESLKALGLRILFEPGRFLVGNAGVLLTTVLYRKETPEKKFLIVDAGMNDLIRPALYQGHHEIVPLQRRSNQPVEKVDVVGPVCESGDFFAENCQLPRVERGEKLAILSAGAYGFTMASNYNARPLPPEILIEGKTMRMVRERQTWEDLIKDELITEED